ncbi:MAG: CBS domain-containing protein [Alphaproteobacteria bacterium]|nr:CBS domain-containing protein [Alphaproteobacteria bacterium]
MNSAPSSITVLDDPSDDNLNPLVGSSLVQGMHTNLDRINQLIVADIMIPRTDIIGLDAKSSQQDLLKILVEESYSRYPVYHGTLDSVTDMVHIKDVFRALAKGKIVSFSAIQHPCLFVSPSMAVLDLLLEMREKRTHLALVVDEFGGNDGLVTIEDILEQIVGSIEDEHDDNTEVPLIREESGGILTSARVRLSALEETIGVFRNQDDLREDVDTLGGLLYGLLGRIPKRGELICHGSGLDFEIVEVDQRMIRTVRIHHIPAEKRLAL